MKLKHRFSLLIILILVAASSLAANPSLAAPTDQNYIIVFKDSVDVPAAAIALERAHGLQVGFVYEHALKGMAATIPAGRLEALQKDPRVAYVVEDMIRTIDAQSTPTGIQRIFANTNPNLDIDANDDYRVDVDVAVIDTGVDFQHPDLNVFRGVNCTSFSPFSTTCSSGGDDDHYHGTHVAGTIGAIDNGNGVVGVAPGARIWAVKVLNSKGSGYSSWIIAGINWVAANAASIEVANMSLGGAGYSQAEYDAIQGAVNKGVAFAVAAGNSDADASGFSPAAFNNVLTVSALADFNGLPGGGAASTCRPDVDDTLADFSNWGSAVDIAAPGVCILSTYPIEKGGYGTISGTSMASPHAAGALALLASRNNPNNSSDVYNLYNQVKSAGNYNWIDDSGDGIKEPLLDVSSTALFNPVMVPGTGGGTPNQPPTAAFTFTTSGLTAAFTDTSTDSDGAIASRVWNFGDGSTSTAQNPTHTYTADGSYNVSLTVTDDGGATGTTSQAVSVSSPANQPPTAGFTFTTTGLTAAFTDTSSDSDGSIVAWSWSFGDSGTSTTRNPSHTYAAAGTYSVSLTVTDNGGATATTSQNVSVNSPAVNISLSVSAYSIRTNKYADLAWTGATATNVDVYRNGTRVTTTPNDGAYTDKPNKTLTSATYKVCEAGTNTCSNEVTVNW